MALINLNLSSETHIITMVLIYFMYISSPKQGAGWETLHTYLPTYVLTSSAHTYVVTYIHNWPVTPTRYLLTYVTAEYLGLEHRMNK